MKILVVEDDMYSRRFMTKFLAKYGDCDTAVDGLEALEAYLEAEKENDSYDAIFLDIMMPKADGVQVLKAIRDFEKQRDIEPENQVKVIMLTAVSDVDYVKKAFDLGCQAYAAKPLNIEKLLEVMKKLNLIDEE